jgi:hypothetical protein
MNIIKTFLPTIIIAWFLVIITFQGNYQYSSFAVGLSKYIFAVGSAWFVDRFLIPEIKTNEILRENPIAYSIFLFANFICATMCFANS